MIFKKGDEGTLVERIQNALRANSVMPFEISGIFDDRTEAAISSFQAANNLKADGIAGAATLAVLNLDFSAYTPNGGDRRVDWILPGSGNGFVGYNRETGGRDQFGTKATIEKIIRLGGEWQIRNAGFASPVGTIQVGDISRRHGGHFPPHATHTDGNAADVRPFRKDNALQPVACDSRDYDGSQTRLFILLFRSLNKDGKVLFNDPVLINENLCRHAAGHGNHLHLIFS